MDKNIKQHLLDFDLNDWEFFMQEEGFPKFRSKQVYQWLHKHGVLNVEGMSNIPEKLKEVLLTKFRTSDITPIDHSQDSSKKTGKLLWALSNKKEVETVWLPYESRISLCISVQSGCTLDCSFCATGKIPFKGNLSTGEILFQVYATQNRYKKRVTNIVFMGMGEPFYNYDNVIKASKILSSNDGLELAKRKITISTVGVFPKIKQFFEEQHAYNLALSVHAIPHKKRLEIMDIEKKYPLADISEFITKNRTKLKKKQVMIEYIMIDNFNTYPEDVELLADLSRDINAKVNLIPLHMEFKGMQTPSPQKMEGFWKALVNKGVLAFNRRSPGFEIQGACGMLAGRNGL